MPDERSPINGAGRIKVIANRSAALTLAVVLVSLWMINNFLENKRQVLESRMQVLSQEHALSSREQALRSDYSSEFDSMVSGEYNAATTRLAWESGIRQLVEQQDAQLERLVLDAQRQWVRQHAVQGYHLNETAGEVEISTVSESDAYLLVSGLTRLPAYASAIESCSIDLAPNPKTGQSIGKQETSRPVRLSCHFNLYEIKRN